MTGLLPLTIGGEPLPPQTGYSVAAMLAGGQQAGQHLRRPADFYPTPPKATRAFLRAEAGYLRAYDGPIAEPCCGEGHMSREIEAFLHCPVLSSDLRTDTGFGVGGVDFLFTKALAKGVRRLITNPPYAEDADGVPLPIKFAVHALINLGVEYLAMLLKQTFWNADNRCGLWRDLRPSRLLQTTFRVNFTGRGSSPVGGLFVVWDRRHEWGAGRYDLICEGGLVR
jgi:hypothetical protein